MNNLGKKKREDAKTENRNKWEIFLPKPRRSRMLFIELYVSPSCIYISFIRGNIPSMLYTSNSFWKWATMLLRWSNDGSWSVCISEGLARFSWQRASTASLSLCTLEYPLWSPWNTPACFHGIKCEDSCLIDISRSYKRWNSVHCISFLVEWLICSLILKDETTLYTFSKASKYLGRNRVIQSML